MTLTTSILLLHAVTTTLMTGLIWFVQVVHYPLMGSVGGDAFRAYERQHQDRTTRIVAPLMLAELITAAAIAARADAFGVPPAWAAAGLALVLVIWFSTALVQVPLHRRLESGFDERAWRRLVGTNWIRTAAWSARTVIALLFLYDAAPG